MIFFLMNFKESNFPIFFFLFLCKYPQFSRFLKTDRNISAEQTSAAEVPNLLQPYHETFDTS